MINATLLYMITSNRDLLTGGGPADRNQLKTLEQAGWQRYSFKVGNKYASFSGLDPIGTHFGILVDLVEQLDDGNELNTTLAEQVFAAATISMTRNLTEKSYLAGLTLLSDALTTLLVDSFLTSCTKVNHLVAILPLVKLVTLLTLFSRSFLSVTLASTRSVISLVSLSLQNKYHLLVHSILHAYQLVTEILSSKSWHSLSMDSPILVRSWNVSSTLTNISMKVDRQLMTVA
jgi:hypothetical protein